MTVYSTSVDGGDCGGAVSSAVEESVSKTEQLWLSGSGLTVIIRGKRHRSHPPSSCSVTTLTLRTVGSV